jgi:hypothetical protein
MQLVKNITDIKYFLSRAEIIDTEFIFNVTWHSLVKQNKWRSLPTFVTDFSNCSATNLPAIVTHDRHLITNHVWPLTSKAKNKPHKVHKMFTRWGDAVDIKMPPITKQFNETWTYVWLPIDEDSAENPWHIWIDVISKFRLLEKRWSTNFSKYIFILSNQSNYFNKVANEIFPELKYHVMPKNETWKFQQLIVPSMSNHLDGIVTPNLPLWLQHLGNLGVGYRESFKPHRKIFITRKDASNRNITNQEQLLLALKGWETITLDTLTIKEQIKVFAEATHILAAHGAGLINLLWCAKDTKVIEIQHKEFIDKKVYPILSHHLGLKHSVYLAETDKVNIKKTKNKKLKDLVNLKVNVAELLTHLD